MGWVLLGVIWTFSHTLYQMMIEISLHICVRINLMKSCGEFNFFCDSIASQSATNNISVIFKFSAPTLTINQLRCWRKQWKTVFFYSSNVEEAQSLHWLVWVRIKVKSLFLKHSCADITVICARVLLMCFTSVCQTECCTLLQIIQVSFLVSSCVEPASLFFLRPVTKLFWFPPLLRAFKHD